MNLQKLIDLMRQEFGWLDGREVGPGMSLTEDLQLDSVALVHLQVAVEDSFSLRFHPVDDDLMAIFATVGNLAAAIDAKLG